MKKIFAPMCVLVWLLGLPNVRGQSIRPSTINVSGSSGTIGSTLFDWSIGELTLVSTFTGSSVIITQGLLQNNKTGTSVQSVSAAEHIQVFPNPANTIVNLKYTAAIQGELSYRLMDMTGRMIINHNTEIQQGITLEQLNISELAAATYLLEVSFKSDGASEEMTSFKIEKLK
ncbi:MAG: T9SS type A sorting domain-containing protein [Chitinophagales bacterium]